MQDIKLFVHGEKKRRSKLPSTQDSEFEGHLSFSSSAGLLAFSTELRFFPGFKCYKRVAKGVLSVNYLQRGDTILINPQKKATQLLYFYLFFVFLLLLLLFFIVSYTLITDLRYTITPHYYFIYRHHYYLLEIIWYSLTLDNWFQQKLILFILYLYMSQAIRKQFVLV